MAQGARCTFLARGKWIAPGKLNKDRMPTQTIESFADLPKQKCVVEHGQTGIRLSIASDIERRMPTDAASGAHASANALELAQENAPLEVVGKFWPTTLPLTKNALVLLR
jgi:hypothetical protein